MAIPSNAKQPATAAASFTLDNHTTYHLRIAQLSPEQRALIAATHDGSLLAYTLDGQPLWSASLSGEFPFDLCAADLDNDGNDELLVATGNGSLHAFSSDGHSLWTYQQSAPLFQVTAARSASGNVIIATGGVAQTLAFLSPQGKALHQQPLPHCIRHVRTAQLHPEQSQSVIVATASRGLSGYLSLYAFDPVSGQELWSQHDLGTRAHNSGKRFFSLLGHDLDNDGRDEIILSNSWGEHGKIFGFNHRGEPLFTESDPRIPNIPYRMNLLHAINLPDDRYLLGHFGNVLIRYEVDGSCRDVVSGPFSPASAAFDPSTGKLFLGTEVSGGDGVYTLDLADPHWPKAFASIEPDGKLARIAANLDTLRQQVAAYQPPAYQPESPTLTVVTSRPPTDLVGPDLITFVKRFTLSQRIDDPQALWCRHRDRRRDYDLAADQIVARAAKLEKAKQPFILWAGHGKAAYLPLSTLQRVLDAAPHSCWGFEFAEMESADADMQELVEKHIKPLAQLCADRHKKIFLRNKNIFWNGSVYRPYWRDSILQQKFADVFVPGLEETNCRTQELSLMARIGLWRRGIFDRWAARIVTDNANFDRMWEWGGQQILSHHIRHMVSRAALGARVFVVDIHQGPFTESLYPQLDVVYQMMQKGILLPPQPGDLLSLSPLSLQLSTPPDSDYLQHGTNGHDYRFPDDSHPELLFDRLDCYWAGTSLPDHDTSTYLAGIQRRLANYLPPFPHGLVPIEPYDPQGPSTSPNFITDGRLAWQPDGPKLSASQARQSIETTLQEGAQALPVLVEGKAHWIASRLDDRRIRLTLVDPGYFDPQDRKIEIRLQDDDVAQATDILSGEPLPVANRRISLTIPAGSLRIIDLSNPATPQNEQSKS